MRRRCRGDAGEMQRGSGLLRTAHYGSSPLGPRESRMKSSCLEKVCCGAGAGAASASASFSLRGVEPGALPRPRVNRSKLLDRLTGFPGVGLLPRGDTGTKERPPGLGGRCFFCLLHEK